MSDPHWRVEFVPCARKDLLRLDRQVQRRVIEALDRLAAGERLSRRRPALGANGSLVDGYDVERRSSLQPAVSRGPLADTQHVGLGQTQSLF